MVTAHFLRLQTPFSPKYMASKNHLLSWCSVCCMHVFRVDYLALDNQLVCSSLEKTKWCPSNKDFPSTPEGNQGWQRKAVFWGSFLDSLLANNSKFCGMENWLVLALHVRANSNSESKFKSSLFNSPQRQNSKETSSFCTCYFNVILALESTPAHHKCLRECTSAF